MVARLGRYTTPSTQKANAETRPCNYAQSEPKPKRKERQLNDKRLRESRAGKESNGLYN